MLQTLLRGAEDKHAFWNGGSLVEGCRTGLIGVLRMLSLYAPNMETGRTSATSCIRLRGDALIRNRTPGGMAPTIISPASLKRSYKGLDVQSCPQTEQV